MTRALIAALLLATGIPMAARADSVTAIIDRAAAAYNVNAGCMEALAYRESTDDPYAVNVSGAYGLFQFTPGGVWLSTPYGRQGIPVSAVSVEEQARMAAMLMSEGNGDAWGVWC